MASYTVPAIRGQMGSTVFYQAVMRADELAATVRAAMDFQEFDTFMAHERMQRKLNEERVERQIVPYLTNSADRFFGSLIVLVYQPLDFKFETLDDLGSGSLSGPYRAIGSTMGALTIRGGKLFALDGQHRLHALRTVISQSKTPHLGLEIKGPFRDAVKNDTLSVIFLEYSNKEKARRIFNKVNRYAKPTSTSTNILTSEDDGIYIITRCVASLDDPVRFDSDVEPPITLRYVDGREVTQLEGSSIKQGSKQLFTLELLSKSIEAMCKATGQPNLHEAATIVRPEDDVLRTAYEECAKWWRELMRNFTPFSEALDWPGELPKWRQHNSGVSVAYRPNGQEALIKGLMEAHAISKLSAKTLVERLHAVPMGLDHDLWEGILLGLGGARRKAMNFSPLAANLVTYLLIGPDAYGARRTQQLLENFIEAKAKVGITRRVLPQSKF